MPSLLLHLQSPVILSTILDLDLNYLVVLMKTLDQAPFLEDVSVE